MGCICAICNETREFPGEAQRALPVLLGILSIFSKSSAIRGLWGVMRRGFGVDVWTGLKSLSMVSFPWLINEIQYEEKRVIKFYLFSGSL